MATSIPGSQVRVGGGVDWLAVNLAHALISVLEENALCSVQMQQVLVPSASREKKTCPKKAEGTSAAAGARFTFDLLGSQEPCAAEEQRQPSLVPSPVASRGRSTAGARTGSGKQTEKWKK